MASAFEQFQRPGDPEVAGSAFEPTTWRQQLQNYRQLEDQEGAWRSAEGSPWKPKEPGAFAKMVGSALESKPGQQLMDLANFLGPGPKMVMRSAVAARNGPTGIRAYHGSPHDFDRFDLSKIGTGEGAQAFGHGLYFAENEGIANVYRNVLAQNRGRVDAKPGVPEDVRKLVESAAAGQWGDDYAAVSKQIADTLERRLAGAGDDVAIGGYRWDKETAQSALDALRKGDVQAAMPGRMYEVNIKADPSQFLDYDVPISQQPQARAAIEQSGFMPYTVVDQAGKRLDLSRGMSKADAEAYAAAKGGKAIPKEDFDFDAITKAYRGKDAEISAALREAGIPGIRYKDAGSRGADGGTSNYVVFDDKLIDIIKKYGLAGLLAGSGALSQGGSSDGGAY